MSKRFLLILLLIPLLLAACKGEQPTQVVADSAPTDAVTLPTDTVKPQPTPTENIEPLPTPTESTDMEEVAAEDDAEAETIDVDAGMGCTFVSTLDETPSPYADFFSPLEYDWVSGAETATVTIVEYSDFQ